MYSRMSLWHGSRLGTQGEQDVTLTRSINFRSEAVGAGVGDEVRRVVGAVPEVVAFGRARVPPDAGGFGAVVSSAEAGESVGVGLSGWSAFVEGDVGDDVLLVAVLGGDGAAREDAVAVAELDELASSTPVGRVGRRRRGGPCSARVG